MMAPAEGDTITDLYGFEIKVNVQGQAVRMQCDGSSRRLEGSWLPFVEQTKLPPEHKLKEMVRKGVPPTLRSWVWMECSGGAARKAAVGSKYYANMALAGEKSPHLKEIDKDIQHTFPNHPWLQTSEGKASLRAVLAAYSVHNEKVGYCRSMNQIVAMLLVALNRNQETAFWLLDALVQGLLYEGTFDKDLVGCQVEMKALDELIRIKLPALHAHLELLEADVSVVATDWFLTLFATSLPSETVARAWDALFNEGPKILFRVALALLKTQEAALLRCDNAGELFMLVRQGAAQLHDRDKLMDVAFEGVGSLPMAVIDKYREQRSAEVEAAVRERQAVKLGEARGTRDEASMSQDGNGKLNEQLSELGKQAGVLGKQAASNMKKGFGQLMAGMKELGTKATAKVQQVQLGKTSSSTDFSDRAAVGSPRGVAAAAATAPASVASYAAGGGDGGSGGGVGGSAWAAGIGAYAGGSSASAAAAAGDTRSRTTALDEDPDSLL